jgi:hypothetical protein
LGEAIAGSHPLHDDDATDLIVLSVSINTSNIIGPKFHGRPEKQKEYGKFEGYKGRQAPNILLFNNL